MMLESQSSALTVSPIPPQYTFAIMLFLKFLSSFVCAVSAQINLCS